LAGTLRGIIRKVTAGHQNLMTWMELRYGKDEWTHGEMDKSPPWAYFHHADASAC